MKEIFKYSGVPVLWEEFKFVNDEKYDKDMLEKVIESIKRNKVAVKGVYTYHILVFFGFFCCACTYLYHLHPHEKKNSTFHCVCNLK